VLAEKPNSSSDATARAEGPVPDSRLRAFWFLVDKEPIRLLAIAYGWLVAVGFAHLFGTGFAFGLNVVDLASPTDFLIAGLRDPFVTLAAGWSGWGLYVIWRSALTSRFWHRALVPSATALLLLCAFASYAYRNSIVRGPWCDSHKLAPELFDVTLGNASEAELLRIGVTTADFIVFAATDGSAVIAKRDDVKRMHQHLGDHVIRKCDAKGCACTVTSAPRANE
jgi:hypothetical protein